MAPESLKDGVFTSNSDVWWVILETPFHEKLRTMSVLVYFFWRLSWRTELQTVHSTLACLPQVSLRYIAKIEAAPLEYASLPLDESGIFVFSLLDGKERGIEAGVESLNADYFPHRSLLSIIERTWKSWRIHSCMGQISKWIILVVDGNINVITVVDSVIFRQIVYLKGRTPS